MEILELMKQRHSVRRYTDQSIEPEKRAILDALAAQINEETGLHIQIIYDEPNCFDSFLAHYGNFVGVGNYIALVGRKSSDLDEQLGYYGEQLVLKAQELGLNTCWVALSHGKSKASIARGEKQVCLISLGYGAVQGAEHKSRPLHELCNLPENMPDWFSAGMAAALLAPTAMNQQKFYVSRNPDDTVTITCGRGFYTRLDLGIVKYHFEAASGKRVLK